MKKLGRQECKTESSTIGDFCAINERGARHQNLFWTVVIRSSENNAMAKVTRHRARCSSARILFLFLASLLFRLSRNFYSEKMPESMAKETSESSHPKLYTSNSIEPLAVLYIFLHVSIGDAETHQRVCLPRPEENIRHTKSDLAVSRVHACAPRHFGYSRLHLLAKLHKLTSFFVISFNNSWQFNDSW